MSKTMTPSEIADWHDDVAKYATEGSADFHTQAAATILELETGLNNKTERLIDALWRVEKAEAKLKIATEALEPFVRAADKLDGHWAGDDWRWNDSVRSNVTVADIRKASQALARIKGVGDGR